MTGMDKESISKMHDEFSTQRVENHGYPVADFEEQDNSLYAQVVHLIDESHARVSAVVNSEIAELYWQVGDAINKDLLDGMRAEYGSQITQKLSERLTAEHGRGWAFSNSDIVDGGREPAYWPHPLFGQERRARRAARVGRGQYPRGGVHHAAAADGGTGREAAPGDKQGAKAIGRVDENRIKLARKTCSQARKHAGQP